MRDDTIFGMGEDTRKDVQLCKKE